MPDGQTLSSTGFQMTPEFMAAVAEAIGSALTKQPTDAAEGVSAKPAVPSAEIGQLQVQDMINPLPTPTWIRPTHRLASRKFWVTVSTVATLMVQNPIGLNLSPAAQVAIAAVAAIYVAAQAIVDSTRKGEGGGNG